MKLLLAEDERALSNVLVTILRHSGYTVDAVYNGADALDYLACGAYDGVILDIMMPKVDGIEVLRTIRAAGNKVPVLLLTAKSDVDGKGISDHGDAHERSFARYIGGEIYGCHLGARQRRGDKCCVDVYLISAQKAEAARLPRYDKSREEYRLHTGVRKCLKNCGSSL